MAAKRTGPKVAPVATAAPDAPFGELSGRIRELFTKTVVPGPYPVTEKIVIAPPTKGDWAKLDELQNQRMVGSYFLAAALQRSGDQAPTDTDLAELTKIVADADKAYNRLFFGEHLDELMALAEGWQPAEWQAFCDDIKSHFLGRGPKSGVCPHCGHTVDADLAGKDSKPST